MIFQVLNKVTGGKLCATRRSSGGRQLILKALLNGPELLSKLELYCVNQVHNSVNSPTHVNIPYLVASLPTSRQQVVLFALLTSQVVKNVWNNIITTPNNLVDTIRLVARLFQQVRYSHDITILLQPCGINLVTFLLYHMIVSDLLEQPCNKSDKAKLVPNC